MLIYGQSSKTSELSIALYPALPQGGFSKWLIYYRRFISIAEIPKTSTPYRLPYPVSHNPYPWT